MRAGNCVSYIYELQNSSIFSKQLQKRAKYSSLWTLIFLTCTQWWFTNNKKTNNWFCQVGVDLCPNRSSRSSSSCVEEVVGSSTLLEPLWLQEEEKPLLATWAIGKSRQGEQVDIIIRLSWCAFCSSSRKGLFLPFICVISSALCIPLFSQQLGG